MIHLRKAVLSALLLLFCSAAFGQAPVLYIVNYQFVSQQLNSGTNSVVTYRADIVNPGSLLSSVSATVSSTDPYSIRVIPGQDTLQFSPVPASSHVASSNTFSLLVDQSVPLDFSKLQWTFQAGSATPVANAGPNQTAAVGSTVTLNGSGSTNPSGGPLTYRWLLTSHPTGSAAAINNAATVMPTLYIDVPGIYVISLTVSNGSATSTASVTVSTSQTGPVANAGPNQTVPVGATVVLNGSGSTSVDGRALTYNWTLPKVAVGSSAALIGANTVSPRFVADKAGTYWAQLIVSDGSSSSSPSTVFISTQTSAPVANAGPNQSVPVGAAVQLTGAGSTDANGLALTYQWSLISVAPGSAAALNNSAAVNPTFTADRGGTYVAQLTVNNGTVSSSPATVTVTTQTSVQAPIANPGSNQTVSVGSTVTLNGSGTDLQNLPLTYRWSLIGKPGGSAANLSNGVIPNPSFVVDVAGSYVAQLIVNNGFLNSTPATVTIGTGCSQPVANPGPNQSVSVGANVTLDGSASSDGCHNPLTYAWSFTARPPGSTATVSGASSVTPAFTADVAGTFVMQLIVNNGTTGSNPATVSITASASSSSNLGINIPSSVTVAPGQQTPLLLTLGTPAPSGGVFINLSSSDTSIAGVAPFNIFVPQGGTTASRAPVISGATAGSTVITASAYGYASATTVVQVGSGPSLTLSFSPASLTMGANTTQNLTLILSSPAPPGGLTANLSSSNSSVATVPGALTFGANTTSLTVPVTGGSAGSATITASAPGSSSATAGVSITQPAAINISSNTSVAAGQSTTLAVTLTSPAPASGVTVSLSSSDTSKVAVPSSVFISAGTTAPSSPPQISGINAGSATITASSPGYASGSGQVQVTAGAGTSSFSPGSLGITAGAAQSFTLILPGPAPVGGIASSLSSSNSGVATVPATVVFAAGSSSATVSVTGIAAGSATVSAYTPNFGSASANVTVTAAQQAGISMQANTIIGAGQSTSLSVTLTAPAPASGVAVSLSSSDSSKVAVTPSVFISAGTTAPSSPPQISGISAGSVTITASASGYTPGSGQVQVTAGAGTSSLSPGSIAITAGTAQTLTLILSGPAPSGGVTANLSSSNSGVANVPATITVPGGFSSATVSVTGIAAGSSTISANTPNFGSASANVTVSAASSNGIIASASVSIAPGVTAPFPVTLGTPAPSGGMFISLVSSDTSKVAVAPANIFISEGASLPNRVPTVTGIGAGSAIVNVSAFGYTSANAQVLVASGIAPATPGLSFSPSAITMGGIATQNVTLVLSSAAPAGGLAVNINSSNNGVATAPLTVTCAGGASTVNVPVTSVAGGSATITASASGYSNATATVTVSISQPSQGAVLLPSSTILNVGQSASFSVTLPQAAPSGGVTVPLVSNDTSTVTITPSVFIAAGQTTPGTQPQVNGLKAGIVSITASAIGYAPGIAQVQVSASTGSGSSYFSPTNITVSAGQPLSLTLFLSGPAPAGGVTAVLTSSNPAIAAVFNSVFFDAGVNSITTNLAAGTTGLALINATTQGFGNATASVTVSSVQTASATWYGGCWETATLYGYTGNYQAIDYALSAPAPVPLQGTLFFAPNCSTSGGSDNMNDNNALTNSGHSIQGFSHHPDFIPSSAIFWFGTRTADGMCPAGAPCSGCVNYNQSTPNCNLLP